MKDLGTSIKKPFSILSFLRIKKIILVFLLASIQWVSSQNSQLFHIPDSLKNKSYIELFNNLNLNYSNPEKALIYVKAYLHKAKNTNDTVKIANAYSQFASLAINGQLALVYADSIISLTKDMEHFVYPGYGYMIKGMSNYNLGYYHKALKYNLMAQEYATKNNNIEQTLYIKSIIGKLKNFWGNYNEALALFKSIIQQIEQLNKKEYLNKNNLYLSTIYSISNSYIFAKKLDSSLLYANIGKQISLELNDSIEYYKFVSQTGIIAYYQNNFKLALESFDKALPYETFSNGFLNDHYYRGNIYWKQQKNDKAFYHFTKADSIYNSTNDVVPEVRDIQEYFVQYYKNNNDTKKQLKYINRLLYVDSIIASNYKNLNETIAKKYDTPLLISEKEKIIKKLKTREKKSLFTIFGLLILVLIITIFLVKYYKKQRIFKKRFNLLLLSDKKEVGSENPLKKSTQELNSIPNKIVNSVLLALEEFEISNAFLANELALNSLSKSLNTNSNYLSKIINHVKKKNFSTYISDLRIDYCLEKLKTDATFRKYTISAIAFEVGFNNVESFSKAFSKRTGLKPSYFIKKLEKKIKN